jgi:hypothetical protein
LPVIDDEGGLVGVVTLGSLVLRGQQDTRALETAKQVSRRAAKRPEARAAGRSEDRAATRPAAKAARRAAGTKTRRKTAARRLKRAS